MCGSYVEPACRGLPGPGPGSGRSSSWRGFRLSKLSESLAQRHCVRIWEKAWFDLHDLPATDITAATKIVVPDIAEYCRFAVDRRWFFPLHSAYYVVLHDDRTADYIAAILNSTIVEFTLRLLSPVAKDGLAGSAGSSSRRYQSRAPISMSGAWSRVWPTPIWTRRTRASRGCTE